MKIAVLGATGCIGKNLLMNLSYTDDHILAFYRSKPGYESANIKWIQYDLSKDNDLQKHLKDVDLIYYFIHSLDTRNFVQKEKIYAESVNKSAKYAGVKKIVYLGGIQTDTKGSSAHMESRKETGRLLAMDGIDVWEFRASIVLAKCSVSFQIALDLARKLPIMVVPKWLKSECSPIYIDDLIDVLVKAKDIEFNGHKISNVGAGITTYEELLVTIRSDRLGKHTKVVSSPLIALKGSALWIWLVTGVDFDIAWHLSESLIHNTSTDPSELEELLGRPAVSMEEALQRLI